MKPKITFTTLNAQSDKSAYWKTKSFAERWKEGFRLTQKAYHEFFSQPNPKMSKKTRLFVKLPEETLEAFFERKNRSK